MENVNISEEEMKKSNAIVSRITEYYTKRIVGQKNLQSSLLIALIANGHILVESVPGLAKTTAAKVLTESCGGKFSRIQCTPDLLPSDIVGTQTYNAKTAEFETKIGPVCANFVLLDEINRSSSKTQSAMLEAMQERQVSIGGEIFELPEIFVVIATQNPIEQEGTYLLSEAQQDRFIIKETITYPTAEEEFEVLNRIENNAFEKSEKVVNLEHIKYLQDLCKKVYIDEAVKKYIVEIVQATREPSKVINAELAKYVTCGASTRASIAFMEASKAIALINGRAYVTPDDVKEVAQGVLRHRITLSFEAVADNVAVETVINAILYAVKAP
ncbi:MAG: MoxR family ATPase [Clostridia bacterium]|nr:MoxR family ATPase [Clostridia bacterium]